MIENIIILLCNYFFTTDLLQKLSLILIFMQNFSNKNIMPQKATQYPHGSKNLAKNSTLMGFSVSALGFAVYYGLNKTLASHNPSFEGPWKACQSQGLHSSLLHSGLCSKILFYSPHPSRPDWIKYSSSMDGAPTYQEKPCRVVLLSYN